MIKMDGIKKIFSVVRCTKNQKFIKNAVKYKTICQQIDELNIKKKAISQYFLDSFSGKDFRTYLIEDEKIAITKVEGTERESFDWKKCFNEHPELVKILSPYKKKGNKTADYIKMYDMD